MNPRPVRFSLLVAFVGLLGLGGPAAAEEIGGRYLLQNHFAEPVTDADFQGKMQLVFFGYTFCPDVCPTTLQVVTETLEMLGPKADQFQPLFITVDPARDTTAVLRDYLSAFHPSIVGLTGRPHLIEYAVKAYKIEYQKVVQPDDDPDDYTVDHTATLFLMDPAGQYLTRYYYGITSDQLFAELSKFTD